LSSLSSLWFSCAPVSARVSGADVGELEPALMDSMEFNGSTLRATLCVSSDGETASMRLLLGRATLCHKASR
jgi:hypothetical protein